MSTPAAPTTAPTTAPAAAPVTAPAASTGPTSTTSAPAAPNRKLKGFGRLRTAPGTRFDLINDQGDIEESIELQEGSNFLLQRGRTDAPQANRESVREGKEPSGFNPWMIFGMLAFFLLVAILIVLGVLFAQNNAPNLSSRGGSPVGIGGASNALSQFQPLPQGNQQPVQQVVQPPAAPQSAVASVGAQPAGNTALLPNLTFNINNTPYFNTQNGIGTAGAGIGGSSSITNSGVVQNMTLPPQATNSPANSATVQITSTQPQTTNAAPTVAAVTTAPASTNAPNTVAQAPQPAPQATNVTVVVPSQPGATTNTPPVGP